MSLSELFGVLEGAEAGFELDFALHFPDAVEPLAFDLRLSDGEAAARARSSVGRGMHEAIGAFLVRGDPFQGGGQPRWRINCHNSSGLIRGRMSRMAG